MSFQDCSSAIIPQSAYLNLIITTGTILRHILLLQSRNIIELIEAFIN